MPPQPSASANRLLMHPTCSALLMRILQQPSCQLEPYVPYLEGQNPPPPPPPPTPAHVAPNRPQVVPALMPKTLSSQSKWRNSDVPAHAIEIGGHDKTWPARVHAADEQHPEACTDKETTSCPVNETYTKICTRKHSQVWTAKFGQAFCRTTTSKAPPLPSCSQFACVLTPACVCKIDVIYVCVVASYHNLSLRMKDCTASIVSSDGLNRTSSSQLVLRIYFICTFWWNKLQKHQWKAVPC